MQFTNKTARTRTTRRTSRTLHGTDLCSGGSSSHAAARAGRRQEAGGRREAELALAVARGCGTSARRLALRPCVLPVVCLGVALGVRGLNTRRLEA
jgi:hypothetical protein